MEKNVNALTKKCAACKICNAQIIQQISEEQLWATLEMKKRSGLLYFVTESGHRACTSAELSTRILFEVLHKAEFFCFEGKEAYQIVKK